MTESRCANNLDVVEDALRESMARRWAAVISHAPGFFGDAFFGPEFERSYQGVLGQFFCDADIVGDSGNGGEEPCRLDLPHGRNRVRHILHACWITAFW